MILLLPIDIPVMGKFFLSWEQIGHTSGNAFSHNNGYEIIKN